MILFAHNDNDGILSALVYTLHREAKEIRYIGYQDVLDLDELKDKDVVFVDFCPKNIKAINDVALSLTVYDHHRLADDIIEMPNVIHSYKEAGCSLVWKTLFPSLPMSKLIQQGKNRDLFQKDGETDLVFLAINAIRGIVGDEILPALSRYLDDNRYNELLDIGRKMKPIYMESLPQIESIFNNIAIIKSTAPQLASDAAWYAYQMDNIHSVILWYPVKDGFGYGFRTRLDVDLSTFAKSYGGGGHPKACGATSKLLPEEIAIELSNFIIGEKR